MNDKSLKWRDYIKNLLTQLLSGGAVAAAATTAVIGHFVECTIIKMKCVYILTTLMNNKMSS